MTKAIALLDLHRIFDGLLISMLVSSLSNVLSKNLIVRMVLSLFVLDVSFLWAF